MSDDLVTIATFPLLLDAQVSKLHLEGAGFNVYLADAETVTMDWFLGNAIGYIKLQVSQSQAEAASALLEKARVKHPPADEPAVDGPDTCLQCGAVIPDEAERCADCGWSYVDDAKSQQANDSEQNAT